MHLGPTFVFGLRTIKTINLKNIKNIKPKNLKTKKKQFLQPWPDTVVADLGLTVILHLLFLSFLFVNYFPSSLNGTQPKLVTCWEVSEI